MKSLHKSSSDSHISPAGVLLVSWLAGVIASAWENIQKGNSPAPNANSVSEVSARDTGLPDGVHQVSFKPNSVDVNVPKSEGRAFLEELFGEEKIPDAVEDLYQHNDGFKSALEQLAADREILSGQHSLRMADVPEDHPDQVRIKRIRAEMLEEIHQVTGQSKSPNRVTVLGEYNKAEKSESYARALGLSRLAYELQRDHCKLMEKYGHDPFSVGAFQKKIDNIEAKAATAGMVIDLPKEDLDAFRVDEKYAVLAKELEEVLARHSASNMASADRTVLASKTTDRLRKILKYIRSSVLGTSAGDVAIKGKLKRNEDAVIADFSGKETSSEPEELPKDWANGYWQYSARFGVFIDAKKHVGEFWKDKGTEKATKYPRHVEVSEDGSIGVYEKEGAGSPQLTITSSNDGTIKVTNKEGETFVGVKEDS